MPLLESTLQNGHKEDGQRSNVGPAERLVSTAIGSALALNAVRKPSIVSIAGALVGADLIYRGVSGRCQIYGALGVNTAAAAKAGSEISSDAPEVVRAITIARPPEDLYLFWKDPQNLARISAHFAEVTPSAGDITAWRVKGPLNQMLTWESRTREVTPGRKLAWESLPGSSMPNNGDVSFEAAPNGIGSEVKLRMRFEPPLGALGAQLVKTFHLVPRTIAGKTLRRFKSLIETGEIPTLENNPSARGKTDLF